MTSGSGPTAVVNTLILSVRRPFESRRTTRAGAPPGTVVLDEQISTITHTMISSAHGESLVLPVAPGTADFDVRVDAALDRLVKEGGLERRERRRVVGRHCQVYRSNGPLAADITPLVPAATSHTDTCLDEAGLVLERVQFDGGVISLRDIAVSVEESPSFAAAEFFVEVSSTISFGDGGGLVLTVDPLSPTIAVTRALPAPPPGFTFIDRFAVASTGLGTGVGGQAQERVASIVDVYTRGADFFVLEEGGSTTGGRPLGPRPFATPVDLGPLGPGELILGTRGSEVRSAKGTRFIRLIGTLPPDQLVELARSLVPAPGGD